MLTTTTKNTTTTTTITTMKMFDTHTHYDDEIFDGDRDDVICSLASAGVSHVLNASYDLKSSEASRELSARYGFIWRAAGIHPHNAAGAPPGYEKALEHLLSGDKAVALGEIGLDYHYDFSPRDVQREVFEKQLTLACKLGVPVIIHEREANEDVLDILRACRGALRGGVYHCFMGDRGLAARVLELGFHIAFGGALTFKKSDHIADAAAYAPSDRILLETDCPYMSPAPFRGKRNDSTRLALIAERAAQIRKIDIDEIAEITTENAKRLFMIP